MIIQLFIAIISFVSIILSTTTIADTQHEIKQSKPTILLTQSSPKTTPQATHQRFIVELKSPGIATYEGGIKQLLATAPQQGGKVNIQSTAAKTYAHFLGGQQTQFGQELAKATPNARVEQHFKTLLNGVIVTGKNLSLKQLSAMKNVKSVYREQMYKVNTGASTKLTDTQAILTALSKRENDGRGIRIAIIDTGIRPENPMFADDGFTKPTTNMPTDDYCSSNPNFCNNKLIVARWSKPIFPICSSEYMSPLGYISHGSHVAGIAAGDKVSTTYNGKQFEFSGVAPAAYIMTYKALYNDPTCSVGIGSNIMLIDAMEHAVNDGADVINNSWGGAPGSDPDTSPYKTVYEAAEKAGVVVVTAAGNSGNLSKTIDCPACIDSGIAVANSTSGYFFANGFNIDGGAEQVAIDASNHQLTNDVIGPVIAAKNIDPDNADGCHAFASDTFNDSIAIIIASNCPFRDKAINAQNAGAKGLVVYNDNNGLPLTMSLPDINLPSVMISAIAGNNILAHLNDNTVGTISAQINRIADGNLAGIIHYTSSRGPNGNENVLKPNIAAPGTDILSAASPDDFGTNFIAMTGTSMASPYVAGAAALVRQLHPDWSANDIKTALTSTSHNENIFSSDGFTLATPFVMGSGQVDIEAAISAALTFDKSSISADFCGGSCEFTRTVHNKTNDTMSLSLSATITSDGIDVDVSVSPASIELKSGESANFTVTVSANASFDGSSPWVFGNLIVASSEHQQAHLPIAVLASATNNEGSSGGALSELTLLILSFIVLCRVRGRSS